MDWVLVMVDCSILDLESIPQSARRDVVAYVYNKGVRPGDLGITSHYLTEIRSGRAKVSDNVLCKALSYISMQELTLLLHGYVPSREATPEDVIKVAQRAKVDPAFREYVLQVLNQVLGDYIRELSREWVVTHRDIDAYIKSMRLDGRSKETINQRLRYITKALAALNWTLEPESLREYLAELKDEEGEHVLRHVTVSLKSLLKRVLKPRDPGLFSMLYSSFTTYKPKNQNKHNLPTLDELRSIFNAIETTEAKAYFLILAETGLRPGEPFIITMDDVDLKRGILRVGKVTETKRSFIAFLRPETLDWIKTNYLLRREEFLKMVLPGISNSNWAGNYAEHLRSKFLPFDRARLRREIREASRKAIGHELELYDLRKFFASWMIAHGVPETIVNTLQGRAPPAEYRVLVEHYWSPRHEELRQWYLKNAPCILCS